MGRETEGGARRHLLASHHHPPTMCLENTCLERLPEACSSSSVMART